MDQTLLVFVTVAEQRHFSRAAEELHLTQPAVSLHIRNLEQRYGVKLLQRNNKIVQLTKAGEIVYDHAKKIMNQYQQIQRRLDDLLEQPHGPISIGSSLTFGEYILPYVIAQFRSNYPDISPSIFIENTSHVAEQLVRHELDMGIIEAEFEHPDLDVVPFLEDTMVVIVPRDHPLASEYEVPAKALEGEMWIVRERGSGTREVTEKMWEEVGIRPTSMMEFGSTQIIKESVEAGLGVACVSQWTLRKERTLDTLRVLRIQGHVMRRYFSWVMHKSQFRTKATDLFIDFLSNPGLYNIPAPKTPSA